MRGLTPRKLFAAAESALLKTTIKFVMSLFAAASLALTAQVIASTQLTPWEIRAGAPGELTETGASLQSDYYRVAQWGLLRTRTTLWHDEWFYPTPDDRNPPACSISTRISSASAISMAMAARM